jgi:SMC interacting uncharacterized protein involved in chromosome segregation
MEGKGVVMVNNRKRPVASVQDTRPLKSKQYQTDMIIGLIEYLEGHGFCTQDGHSPQFTVEDLRMPTTTAIQQIFEFLIKQVDERFSLDRLDQVSGFATVSYKSGIDGVKASWLSLLHH